MRDQIETIVNLRQQLNAKSPDPVIDAALDAVTSSDPEYRYVLHGGPFPVDPLAVRPLFYPYPNLHPQLSFLIPNIHERDWMMNDNSG